MENQITLLKTITDKLCCIIAELKKEDVPIPQIDIELTGWECRGGTWQYDVITFTDGIETDRVPFDSGTSCEDVQPIDVELLKDERCDDVTGTIWVQNKILSLTDPEDPNTAVIQNIGAEFDTGIPCAVEETCDKRTPFKYYKEEIEIGAGMFLAYSFNDPADPLGGQFSSAAIDSATDLADGDGVSSSTPGFWRYVDGVFSTSLATARTNDDFVEWNITIGSLDVILNIMNMRYRGTDYDFSLEVTDTATSTSTLLLEDESMRATGFNYAPTRYRWDLAPLQLEAGKTYNFKLYLYNTTGGAGGGVDRVVLDDMQYGGNQVTSAGCLPYLGSHDECGVFYDTDGNVLDISTVLLECPAEESTAIDYTAKFDAMLVELGNLNTSNSNLENEIIQLQTDVLTLDSDNDAAGLASILATNNNILASLQDIEGDTDPLAGLLADLNNSLVSEADQSQLIQQGILDKLNEPCTGSPQNVKVCNADTKRGVSRVTSGTDSGANTKGTSAVLVVPSGHVITASDSGKVEGVEVPVGYSYSHDSEGDSLILNDLKLEASGQAYWVVTNRV